MGERKKLGILKIENEEKVLYGDFEADFLCIDGGSLTIYGNIRINNNVVVNRGELIVSNNLIIADDLILFHADVSAKVLVVKGMKAVRGTVYAAVQLVCYGIKVIETHIGARECYCFGNIEIVDGNLEVSDLEARDIFSNADITIHGNADVKNVECFNYLVDGRNIANYVYAMKIYILGPSVSYGLRAAEIFLGAEADLQGSRMIATSHFEVGGKVMGCSEAIGGELSLQ